MASSLNRLVVVTSTYPRWQDDNEPRFPHDLARHLLPFFDVTVLCPRAPGASATDKIDGVEVIRFAYAPRRLETLVNDGGILGNLRRSPWKVTLIPLFVLACMLRLRRVLAQGEVAVVHAHWLVPGGLIAAAAARPVPFVATAHGSDVFALRGSVMNALKRWVLTKAASATVVSGPMADRLLADDVAAQRPLVVPMGVDIGTFSPDPSIKRDRGHILFVGRLVRIKGCDTLLRAFSLLVERNPGVRLSIVGDGPERENLRTLAGELGVHDRVTFHGARTHKELIGFYRSATMLAWPSVRLPSGQVEGLGMVAVEAAACGCPVLAADQPAISWLLKGLERSLFKSGDEHALFELMCRRLDTPLAFIAHDAEVRERVIQELDWRVIASRYAQILKEASGA